MPTRRKRSRRNRSKRNRGGMFGRMNEFKDYATNERDFDRWWKGTVGKNGQQYNTYIPTTYWPGSTNKLLGMQPQPNYFEVSDAGTIRKRTGSFEINNDDGELIRRPSPQPRSQPMQSDDGFEDAVGSAEDSMQEPIGAPPRPNAADFFASKGIVPTPEQKRQYRRAVIKETQRGYSMPQEYTGGRRRRRTKKHRR